MLGVLTVSYFQTEKNIVMNEGDSVVLSNYDIQLKQVEIKEGENYVGHQGRFEIKKYNKKMTELLPEKRFYFVHNMATTETAIDPGLFRDIYVVLGSRIGQKQWSVRVQHKPFVRLIWLGAILMALGAFFAWRTRCE